jgi:hypothetical protein
LEQLKAENDAFNEEVENQKKAKEAEELAK